MEVINNDFDKLLKDAIDACRGEYKDEIVKHFSLIYPFATENIAGYINEFELKNKRLFTVGSSFDQAINASLFDCKNITVFDICPFTRFYAYLKLSCLLECDNKDFLSFLSYRKYFPLEFKENGYSKKVFDRIKNTLKSLDLYSYLFWDQLFNTFNAGDIRMGLFYHDEISSRLVRSFNPYLQSEILYNETREKIKKCHIEFLCGDVLTSNIKGMYDTIWLSNIGTWINLEELKIMVDNLSKNLCDDGKMLISYLYQINSELEEEKDQEDIYNMNVVDELLKEYHHEVKSFIGTRGLKFHDAKDQDGVLIYHRIPQKKN